jgi:hypothetical protein
VRIQAFIFNWRGHEARAAALEAAIRPHAPVLVINSEEDLTEVHPGWIHLGESAYFCAQWNKALELFDADLFFHIQADAHSDDFGDLFARALDLFERYEIGILEPHVDHSDFSFNRRLLRTLEPGLQEVPMTDCTCWFIHGKLLRRLPPIDLALNRFGWGVCGVVAAWCSLDGRLCLRDYTRKIHHPKGRGYSSQLAAGDRVAYVNSQPPDVRHRTIQLYERMGRVIAHPGSSA